MSQGFEDKYAVSGEMVFIATGAVIMCHTEPNLEFAENDVEIIGMVGCIDSSVLPTYGVRNHLARFRLSQSLAQNV